MIRLIHVCGVRGSGKTLFSVRTAPDVEIGFVSSPLPGEPAQDLPWPANRCIEGRPIFPAEYDEAGGARLHNFSERARYRALAGIPEDATVARISGDGLMWATKEMGRDERMLFLRGVQALLLHCFDVVIHDAGFHFDAPGDDERLVWLAVSGEDMEARSRTRAWGGRGSFSRSVFQRATWEVLQHRGRPWPGRYDSRLFWWADGEWVSLEEGARRRIGSLGYWYQYAELVGIPVSTVAATNGEEKWRAIRACLPVSLKGLRFLDVGSNAGYNSLRAADEGASVVSYEADERYRRQFRATIEMGHRPPEMTDQVEVREEPVQFSKLSEERWDVALLSAVHYHINRCGLNPYRWPEERSIPHLNLSLAVVLEDLCASADLLVVVTTKEHAERERDPFMEASVAWLLDALPRFGFRDVTERLGADPRWPIVTARGRGKERPVGLEAMIRPGPGPTHIVFYLGWDCNAQCVMCWQNATRKKKAKPWPRLSFESFAAVLVRFSSVRTLELCSFGEPLLHPEFGRMMDFLLRDGRRWQAVNIISNGSLLDRYAGEIGRLPGSLTVSIDSPDPITYSEIRRGLRLGQVVDNIRDLMRRRSCKQRTVGINMVLLRKNVDQIERMAEMASDLGLRYLSLLQGDALSMTDAAEEGLPQDHPGVPEAAARARERFPELQVIDNFTAVQTDRPRRPEGRCVLPWMSLDVDPQGIAHPCCRSHQVGLGSVLEENPWSHPDLAAMREQIVRGEVDGERFPDCAKCPLLRG